MKQFSTKTLKDAGPVIREILSELWKELDTIVDHIMSTVEPTTWVEDQDPNPRDPEPVGGAEEWRQYGEWRGQAQGVAYAIAVLSNPYGPDVDAVRHEAMERWEAGEDE